MELNSDQASAFRRVQSGENIFLTGPAGSGKSFLIRTIVGWATSCSKPISVTALTGCAALLLGNNAKTLHSWAGVGLARESVDVLVANISKNPKTKRRWKKTEILVIDEISMMPPDLFEKMDAIGKKIRNSLKPWGGIQLILCGDYFQLPPVSKGFGGISGEMKLPGRFAFESPLWKSCSLKPTVLTKIERQTDQEFQMVLNECRIGTPSTRTIELLKRRQGLDWKKQLIKPTLLFSRNADVDSINEKNIHALKKPLRRMEAKTVVERPAEDPTLEIPSGEAFERCVQRLDNDASYCATLELCVGCQVMLLVNKDMEGGLVNGSRGVVVDVRTDGVPIVQFLHGPPIAIEYQRWTSNDCAAVHREQIPLRVAYAISIHKSQGATLDCALVDIGSSVFEYGQAYVALSRVRNMESLYIWNLDASKIMAHPTVIQFYQDMMETVEHINEHPMVAGVEQGWQAVLQAWATSTKGKECLSNVEERKKTEKVYPEDPFYACKVTPLHKVKVVILGQDPYHGPGQAHGLSFSVKPGVPLPPSLKNIRKEALSDLGEDVWPSHIGTLTQWAEQGVLLLNSILTVEEGNPASHEAFGWEDLTHRMLVELVHAHANDPLVFLAWGKYAQTIVQKLQLGPNHTIFSSAHPSPLSAHTGFFGTKPFSKTNAYFQEKGVDPIRWSLAQEDDNPGQP